MADDIRNGSESDEGSEPEADDSDSGMPLALSSVTNASKKRKLEDEDSDDSEASDDSSSASSSSSSSAGSKVTGHDDGPEPEIMEVDFEFNDTEEIDYHGIKQLLERSAWAAVNVSEVADALIKQKGVGTCVKIDDTYNCVYGIISAFNIAEAQKNNLNSVGKMCSFLKSVCQNSTTAEALSNSLTAKALQEYPTGILVNERYVNMPPEITPVIHRQLVEDLKWSKEKLEPPSARAQWNLKRLLIVSRCFVDGASQSSGKSNKKKKRKRRRKKNSAAGQKDEEPLVYFLKYEDEIFQKNAIFSFMFDASRVGASKSPAQDTAFGKESYFVALIDVDRLPACIDSMNEMLGTLQEK